MQTKKVLLATAIDIVNKTQELIEKAEETLKGLQSRPATLPRAERIQVVKSTLNLLNAQQAENKRTVEECKKSYIRKIRRQAKTA